MGGCYRYEMVNVATGAGIDELMTLESFPVETPRSFSVSGCVIGVEEIEIEKHCNKIVIRGLVYNLGLGQCG